MGLVIEIGIYVILALTIHILIYTLVTKKKPKDINGKHVVITGGSSGIGLHMAIECARRGASVTLLARRTNLLEKSVKLLELNKKNENQKFQYKSLDLSGNYDVVEKCLQDAEENFGDIEMLINCAGFAVCGVFEEVSIEDAKKLMDINYFGTYHCVRHVLPKMKQRRSGTIVITSSQAALMGIYGYGPYSVAKFALRGLAETIAMETKNFGITVTLAMPADTNTPGFENEEKSKPKETKLISGTGGLANPEDVAKCIIQDKRNIFFHIWNRELDFDYLMLWNGSLGWFGAVFVASCIDGSFKNN
ncbi:3-ketodihydrosphingosine reductase isoform X2 [Condylostylus longicornis]|uniref:3-ketodihydrosphingosine reductase isoform X2 n=1 Tax=Condylostylus longicornis TaxID=2530218 RepID=UPI00244DE576|nr:3-ketodihydrosphingosine reductase isoform X2 [Condylostylus longicornis]